MGLAMMFDQIAVIPVQPGKGQRIENWTRCSAAELWTTWRAQFESDDEAIATAVWMGNRMVKTHAKSTKAQFYSIKDGFIRKYGNEGRRAREEKKVCYDCGGTGDNGWGECDHCGSTGVYSSRWLYLHEFAVAGTQYRLHSYVAPVTLLDENAEDAEQYGGRFTEAELAALALPMTGLLKVLRYVAAALWGMKCMDGRYY